MLWLSSLLCNNSGIEAEYVTYMYIYAFHHHEIIWTYCYILVFVSMLRSAPVAVAAEDGISYLVSVVFISRVRQEDIIRLLLSFESIWLPFLNHPVSKLIVAITASKMWLLAQVPGWIESNVLIKVDSGGQYNWHRYQALSQVYSWWICAMNEIIMCPLADK